MIKLLWAVLLFDVSFTEFDPANHAVNSDTYVIIECDDDACRGSYLGPEFINNSDIAHQFSNTMCWEVGDQLKKLYREQKYSLVDFGGIVMSTEGMGSGEVEYNLIVPFKLVEHKCDATTSFDHVGGWNHSPALSSRKRQLQKALLPGDVLKISPLMTTPEGLQEYWIQWRNKEVQFECLD